MTKMRVNPLVKLGTIPYKLGDKNPAQYVKGKVVITPKNPDLVPSPSMNVWERPMYDPKPSTNFRLGADDHKIHRSRGH